MRRGRPSKAMRDGVKKNTIDCRLIEDIVYDRTNGRIKLKSWLYINGKAARMMTMT